MFGALFSQKQHVLRTFARRIITHPNSGPTPDLETLSSSSSSSSLHLQHLLQSPHYRPLEYTGSAQPESTSCDPSESSRHRIEVRVSLAQWQRPSLLSESKNSSHRIWIRVGGPVCPPSKSSRYWIRFAGPLAARWRVCDPGPSESSIGKLEQ